MTDCWMDDGGWDVASRDSSTEEERAEAAGLYGKVSALYDADPKITGEGQDRTMKVAAYVALDAIVIALRLRKRMDSFERMRRPLTGLLAQIHQDDGAMERNAGLLVALIAARMVIAGQVALIAELKERVKAQDAATPPGAIH